MNILNKINSFLKFQPLKINNLLPNMPLIVGFKSEIISFGYVTSNLMLTHDQIIYLGNERFVIPAGAFKLTLAFGFKNGSVLALSTLRRSWFTTINGKCIGDYDTTEFFNEAIGKTFIIEAASLDENSQRTISYGGLRPPVTIVDRKFQITIK